MTFLKEESRTRRFSKMLDEQPTMKGAEHNDLANLHLFVYMHKDTTLPSWA